MGTTTDYLNLILPLNNEYQDIWDQPTNENFQKIDDWAKDFGNELIDARQGKATLLEFLQVAHASNGTLLATTEIVNSRSSFLYGDENGSGVDFYLSDTLEEGDREVHKAREGYPSLREALGAKVFLGNAVLDGANDVDGYPTWLGFTGANAQVDGSADPVYLLIGGQQGRVRSLKQITISGSAGEKYLYAQLEVDGTVIVDGDSGTPPPATPEGTAGSDGTKVRILEDLTVDFPAAGVEVGDILRILGTTSNSGDYLIEDVAPGGDVNQVQIKGVFPGGTLASLDYEVRDPFGVTLGFDDALAPASGKIYMGEADFDGISITEVRAMHFKDSFVGDWRAADVSGGSPTFEEIWHHNFLSDTVEVAVQVSQANDGSEPVEELSKCTTLSGLGVNINDTYAFDPGTSDASLSGSVTGSLTGSLDVDRSAQVKWDKNSVYVKNPISGKFYRDYGNAQQTSGFIRVVVRKRA